MDTNQEYATIYKFSKPVIIHEGQVLTSTVSEPVIIHEEEKQEPVVNVENKKTMSNMIDDIASDIVEDNTDDIFEDNSSIETPYIESPIISTGFTDIPFSNEVHVEEDSNTIEIPTEEEKQVMELTQELKLDLENAEKITDEFLSRDEINSVILEKKKFDSLPTDELLMEKYGRIYGPEEKGLFNEYINDKNTYMTVLEYLESENVLSVIPYNANVSFANSSETISGVDFIRNVVIPYLKQYGNHSINDTIDILDAHVEVVDEKKSFLKGLFSRH